MKPCKAAIRFTFTFTFTILGSFGCGAVAPDEPTENAQEALGSTSITNWNDLVTKLGTTGSYTLTANIDARGKTWTPKSFNGTFDGGNHTISNLNVSGGGLFADMQGAVVKNLKLTNMTVSGWAFGGIGGLANGAGDSTIQNCAVEVTMNASAAYAGGLVGSTYGSTIYRSYAKGSLSGAVSYSGGLVGIAFQSNGVGIDIHESYAQMTVNPNSSDPANQVVAGGMVGYAEIPDIYDVYAVGNVTGRGAVGGIVGQVDCVPNYTQFLLYKTIYRGDVVDQNWTPNGGWAGSVGTVPSCGGRFLQNFYDRTLDQSMHHYPGDATQGVVGYTTGELTSPTTVIQGVFCEPDTVQGRCGDNTWSSPPWTAGTSSQYHVLLNMPGPNIQPR
jgi:hypothetical protein